jgi:DNA-binding response OmpR family regulator
MAPAFLHVQAEVPWMHIRLAVAADDTAPKRTEPRSGFSPKICDSYWRMKVLIAEDDPDSRELLGWMLQKLGYQVVVTTNGKEAWDTYRKGRFRIVISDVLMPEIDGLELCRRIRLHKQSKYTYIIVITALIGKKDYLEGMDAGADDFVTKPFDPDELKARLRVAERILSFQDQAVADEQAGKNVGTT